MKRGFRRQRRALPPRRLTFLVAVAVMLVFIIYQLDRVVIPFQSENPLWHEDTVGQGVIDNWRYGGENAEGYMEFYQDGDPHEHLLSPNEKILGLDGSFVVIEHHSQNSLTYADPIVAIPMRWILFGVILMLNGLIYLRIRTVKRRLKLTTRKPTPIQVQEKPRNSRFRPHGTRK